MEHLHPVDDDFCGVTLLALLILPLSSLQTPLHVDLGTLLQVLSDDLGQTAIHYAAMPLGALLLLTLLVFPGFGGGHRHVGDGVAIGHVTNLWVLAQIADQDYFINAA